MTIARLREVHTARPFQPFVLRMADAKTLRITHPESLAYNPTGRTMVYVAPNGSSHYVDLLLVARIEVGNGKTSRKSRK